MALAPKAATDAPRFEFPKGPRLGPKTAFNVSITNQRVFAGQSLPLTDAKTIGKRMGVTLNDVVMCLCSGALRRYLDERDGIPKKPLLAGVPVSLREAGNTDMNNQATVMVVNLHTDIADPVERLRAIHASSTEAKQLTGSMKAVIPMDFPSFGAPWLMTGLASMLGRTKLASALPPVTNLVISNVPGSPVPLYLAGARLATYFPVSIPAHGMALNLTVQSYNGSLEFGLTACRKAVPDVRDIAGHLADELDALVSAMPTAAQTTIEATTEQRTPARKAAATKAPGIAKRARSKPGLAAH